jgi:LppX_LprAFG lipoprotein
VRVCDHLDPENLGRASRFGALPTPYDEGSDSLLISMGWITQQRLQMNGLISQAQNSQRRIARPSARAGASAVLFAAALITTMATGCGGNSSTSQSGSSSASPAASGTTSAVVSASPTSPASSGTAAPQVATLIQNSAKVTGDLRSLHVELDTFNITTLPMEQVHGNVNIASEGNGQAKGSATIRSGPNTPAVAKEFVVWNRTMYTKGPDGKYVSMGPAEKIYDPAVILDKDKGLANIIGKVQNPVQAGTENINGIPTVKITGTIDAAVIDVVVPQLGKDGGTLPVTLYIADTSAPATSTVPTPAQPYLVQLGVKKDPGNVRITMSDWGKPYTIEDPTK